MISLVGATIHKYKSIEGNQHFRRIGLNKDITIVPVGGLDKVSTFISLLRGSSLNVACLLDTPNDQKTQAALDKLVMHKIIKDSKIVFFDQFTDLNKSDIEDLFEKNEYLSFFNEAFSELGDVSIDDLDESVETILAQISKVIGKPRFNHYSPANLLAKKGVDTSCFHQDTLDRFEGLFIKMNALM